MNRRPIPGPDEHINIYDLAIMDDAAVRARAENMLDRYPVLRRIYSADFLERLVPDRRNLDNHLLWLLTDTAGDFATGFWAEVSNDLATLAHVGAFEAFGRKLRQTGRIEVHSAKTELELAAWMQRKGYAVTLKPLVPETGRRCEFAAESVPPTSWEVKSVLDQQPVRERERVSTEVQRHLHYINEPYVLDVDARGLTMREVHEVVRSIRQQIREFHRSGGQQFPVTFESHGLEVTVRGRSSTDYGYTGIQPIGPYCLGNEDIRRVMDRAGVAAGLPCFARRGLGFSPLAALAIRGGGTAVIGHVKPRPLEDDPHRTEDLARRAAAGRAGGRRGAHRLIEVELMTVGHTSILVDRHQMNTPASATLCNGLLPIIGDRLHGDWAGYWKLRTGDFRIIYKIVDSIVEVQYVRHRREAYGK